MITSSVGLGLVWVFCFLGSSFSFSIFSNCYLVVSSLFVFDGVSFYLSLLSIMLGVSLFFQSSLLSSKSGVMIGVSLICSVLSYSCVNSLGFWVFYELSILPLLFLLVVESPYSERFIASWYLLGYVVLTSLPMLLSIFYISLELGGFNLISWGLSENLSVSVLMVLGVMFVTKIPLPPFHVWLPIVHAEASSAVSVCLSGYIMKLGVLGVVRFCWSILPSYLFNMGYLWVCLSLASLFFLSASRELDGKRWLAFLSLSHILIGALCLSVSEFFNSGLAFIFCLGHGFSAGVIFILLWVIYEVCGSRNWMLVKFCFPSSLFFRCLCCVCLCTAGSLPPTVQFFSEVLILMDSGFKSILFSFILFIYLFMSGLVPLFILGSLLTRHYCIGLSGMHVVGFLGSVSLLGVWSFILFLVC